MLVWPTLWRPSHTARGAGLVALRPSLYTWRPLKRQLACAFRCGCPAFTPPVVAVPSACPEQERTITVMALFLEFLVQQWMLASALMVAVALLILHESRKGGPSLSPQQAVQVVNAEDGVFVDLREAADFRKGHIVNAVNIPATKLPERMVELEKYRDRPVVLVCKMGQQSGAAGKQLKAANYSKVYKMSGGMLEWANLQLPTVT